MADGRLTNLPSANGENRVSKNTFKKEDSL